MTIVEPPIVPRPDSVAAEAHLLDNGDRMTQPDFHRAYERMPPGFRAELIGGIVYVASPLRVGHAAAHPWLSALLFAYQVATPGVQLGDNGTVILDEEAEPQPDLFLRVLPECGGLSRTTVEDYVQGPPELVVEVAHSSRSIDLHAKRLDYARTGVPEYIVHLVATGQLRWFDLANGQERQPDPDGVIRVAQFPGLWIDTAALAARDFGRLAAVLQKGLAAPDHAAFVDKLAAAGRH
jgi:Uma2 family endonuclease